VNFFVFQCGNQIDGNESLAVTKQSGRFGS
jgi:hypothetical protein